jgi:hypothetical protein
MASVAASAGSVVVALPARSATSVRFVGLAGLCAATLVAPALMLVWMPIVLGVPHVANDLRYLVWPLPRRQVVVALVASGLLVALKAASLIGGVSLLRWEMVTVAVWLLVALALGARRSHAWRRHGVRVRMRPAWIAALVGGVAIIAMPLPFAFIAAMAHNVIAIVVWLVVRRPDRRHALAVVAMIGAAIAVLVLAGSAVASATGGDVTRWLTIDRAAAMMFGGVPLSAGRALVIVFAFLQAVHYAIWLGWMTPSAAVERTPIAPTPRLAVAATTAIVIAAALVDATWARATYLALATFHIYLELVVLAVVLAHRPLLARLRGGGA